MGWTVLSAGSSASTESTTVLPPADSSPVGAAASGLSEGSDDPAAATTAWSAGEAAMATTAAHSARQAADRIPRCDAGHGRCGRGDEESPVESTSPRLIPPPARRRQPESTSAAILCPMRTDMAATDTSMAGREARSRRPQRCRCPASWLVHTVHVLQRPPRPPAIHSHDQPSNEGHAMTKTPPPRRAP